MRRRPSRRAPKFSPDFSIPGSRGLAGRLLLGLVLWALFGLCWLIWKAAQWLFSLTS